MPASPPAKRAPSMKGGRGMPASPPAKRAPSMTPSPGRERWMTASGCVSKCSAKLVSSLLIWRFSSAMMHGGAG